MLNIQPKGYVPSNRGTSNLKNYIINFVLVLVDKEIVRIDRRLCHIEPVVSLFNSSAVILALMAFLFEGTLHSM